MTNNLPTITKGVQAAWRIVRGIPVWISATLSEKHAQHQLRLANVEAYKEALIEESRALVEVRKRLNERYFEASPEGRLGIKRDFEETDRQMRKLHVYALALNHLPAGAAETNPPLDDDKKEDTEPKFAEWMDRFNELAQGQHQAWRIELLSKALAIEAAKPRSILLRTLWTIGTLEEETFHAFAALLDLSANIGGPIIPHHSGYLRRPVSSVTLGAGTQLGHLLFKLDNSGLVAEPNSTQKQLLEGKLVLARYGGTTIVLRPKRLIEVPGIIASNIGAEIAQLYDASPTALGKEIFDAWIHGIKDSIDMEHPANP